MNKSDNILKTIDEIKGKKGGPITGSSSLIIVLYDEESDESVDVIFDFDYKAYASDNSFSYEYGSIKGVHDPGMSIDDPEYLNLKLEDDVTFHGKTVKKGAVKDLNTLFPKDWYKYFGEVSDYVDKISTKEIKKKLSTSVVNGPEVIDELIYSKILKDIEEND